MKKQLLTLAAIPLLFIACSKSSTAPETTPEVIPEKKLVKVEAKMTPIKAGVPVSADTFTWSRKEFDQDGNITLSMIRVGMNGPLSYEEEITYKYENKKVTEVKEGNYRNAYAYIGNTTVEIKKYKLSDLYETETREIGANGKVSKIYYYQAQGEERKLFQTTIFSYDANQRNTTKEFLTPPDLNGDQTIYTYDAKGNVLTESSFNRKTNTIIRELKFGYNYNEKGQLQEYIDGSGSDYKKFKNTYGADGMLTIQELSKSSNFDGPFEQVGQINYTYTYK
ncbi:hypothetical protein [Pedobacter caeni]|uniref:YD repeat-containing protein n=1 Tax=Pedobacter caeni TaxID=288992 RepID=A0A1M4X0F0_9SPHI|nr:hypothetical protein [Pedobacter caeni]SHE86954.1 hypothetical protein SAMN04488522_1011452 [Pedobacter caeni]